MLVLARRVGEKIVVRGTVTLRYLGSFRPPGAFGF